MMAGVSNGAVSGESESWLGAVDVGYLTEAEREAILDVLHRDERVRRAEEERISKLKSELRDVRRKGAKRADNSYATRICARCNNKTGLIINASTQCLVCKHKVCQQCIMTGIFSKTPKCVVCYQETKLKAETGEWFHGLMRPELRSMQDGSTVVKQAVLTKPIHFDQRSSRSTISTPAITCTLASSGSVNSSRKDTASINSIGTEDTGSSTESHKQRRDGVGPAETGSMESLRRIRPVRHTVSTESNDNVTTLSPQVTKSKTLPRNFSRSPKSTSIADVAALLMIQKKQLQRYMSQEEPNKQYTGVDEINTQPFLLLPKKNRETSDATMDDRTSDSSADSKSIDGVFEEYIQRKKEEQRSTAVPQPRQRYSKYSHSYSQQTSVESNDTVRDEINPSYREEAEDHIARLPPPQVSTLPRKLNEKLLRQNRLSVSVPTVYTAQKKNQHPRDINGDHSGSDHGSVEFPLSINRDLSMSVPNLSQSTTSLNSVGTRDLSISGEVEFSLSYNYKTNILLVNITKCRNIALADRRRKRSDPYVKCYLLPDRKTKQKTDVKKRTTNPVYNKCLKFSVSHSELSTRVLELSVWHAGTFTRNLFLGQVQLPLDAWNWDRTSQHWFPLRQRDTINTDFAHEAMYKGDLIIGLKYLSPGSKSPGKLKAPFGELNILIKQAKNLTPMRSNGTVDAHVKIMLHPDMQFKQKTAVIHKCSSPEWNHNVRLQLYQPVEESGLQLTIWHREKLHSSTFLGGCRLNLGQMDQKWMDSTGMEKALWEAAINNPGQWVDDTLQLRPSM